MSSNAVIEIFCKSKDGKSRVGVIFEDDDRNIAFTHEIFMETMNHFVNTSGDLIEVFPYEPEILKHQINHFLLDILNPPGSISAKLYAILQFIENNSDIYEGIKVYI